MNNGRTVDPLVQQLAMRMAAQMKQDWIREHFIPMKRLEIAAQCVALHPDENDHAGAAIWALARADALLITAGLLTPAQAAGPESGQSADDASESPSSSIIQPD